MYSMCIAFVGHFINKRLHFEVIFTPWTPFPHAPHISILVYIICSFKKLQKGCGCVALHIAAFSFLVCANWSSLETGGVVPGFICSDSLNMCRAIKFNVLDHIITFDIVLTQNISLYRQIRGLCGMETF